MSAIASAGLLIGPGSQPEEEDGGAELGYLRMPHGMQTYIRPTLAEPELAQTCPAGLDLLQRLLTTLRGFGPTDSTVPLNLLELPEPDYRLVVETLGRGEVSAILSSDHPTHVQETRLAGVWHCQAQDASGRWLVDAIEVADIPRQIRQSAFAGSLRQARAESPSPDGVLTGRTLMSELNQRTADWKSGDAPQIINLDLLPHTTADLDYLAASLGQGRVVILSRGYGSCRIAATGLQHCWWVRHFNSDGNCILNTIEIIEVPLAALAVPEDLRDSADRLAEILDALMA